MIKNTTRRNRLLMALNILSLRASESPFFLPIVPIPPFYQRLVSPNRPLILFTVNNRTSEITELNKPMAAE